MEKLQFILSVALVATGTILGLMGITMADSISVSCSGLIQTIGWGGFYGLSAIPVVYGAFLYPGRG